MHGISAEAGMIYGIGQAQLQRKDRMLGNTSHVARSMNLVTLQIPTGGQAEC